MWPPTATEMRPDSSLTTNSTASVSSLSTAPSDGACPCAGALRRQTQRQLTGCRRNTAVTEDHGPVVQRTVFVEDRADQADDTSQSSRSPVSTNAASGVSRSMAIRAPMNSADIDWAAAASLSAKDVRRGTSRRTNR